MFEPTVLHNGAYAMANPPRKSLAVCAADRNSWSLTLQHKMDEDLAPTLQNILDQAPSHQNTGITLEIPEMDILWRQRRCRQDNNVLFARRPTFQSPRVGPSHQHRSGYLLCMMAADRSAQSFRCIWSEVRERCS